MPGSVLNYARTKADASTTWNSASPLEEYTLTYSTGDAAKDVTLVAAQWSSADNAKTQYDALVAAQTGDESASGNVKVSGNVTGAYVVKADAPTARTPLPSGRTIPWSSKLPAPRKRSIASTRSSRCSI